jgi:hypothetical protein
MPAGYRVPNDLPTDTRSNHCVPDASSDSLPRGYASAHDSVPNSGPEYSLPNSGSDHRVPHRGTNNCLSDAGSDNRLPN